MLSNKKVYVGKHSKEIQKKAFELGWGWFNDDRKVSYTESPFLFFDVNRIIINDNNIKRFYKKDFEEITAEEILAMEVPKEKYEFKPFEKVLVRDKDDSTWEAAFFEYELSDIDYPYVVIGMMIGRKQCIPYKGNEHLLGTTNEPKN